MDVLTIVGAAVTGLMTVAGGLFALASIFYDDLI